MNTSKILTNPDGSSPAGVSPLEYLQFANGQEIVSYQGKMDIDDDGPGPAGGDVDHQNQTSLRYPNGQSIDSSKVAAVVAHPAIIRDTIGDVLGCVVVVEYNGITALAVCYDEGPEHEAGEGSQKLADDLGIPDSGVSGGVSAVTDHNGNILGPVKYTFLIGIPFPGFQLQASA